MKVTALLLGLFATTLVYATPGITKETVTSGGRARTYYLFIPAGATEASPLLVLLHGSGRDGKILLEHWKRLAEKEGIVLAGPEAIDRRQWQFPADGPILLRDVVKDVQERTAIDPRRVYLFGHSAGASFAIPMGLLQSTYFAALVAHAGSLAAGNEASLDLATRKVPISLIIGVRDAALGNARLAHELLKARSFPVEMNEIPRHGHDYYARAKSINEMAWRFLSQHALAEDPAYVSYANIPD